MDIISESIKLLDIQKLNLRKSFENLQFHYHEVGNLITFIQNSFQDHLESIQSHESKSDSKPNPKSSENPINSDPVTIRSELKSFCEKNNGRGLVHYIIAHPKDHKTIREELAVSFRGSVAANPVALVLDAMQNFYSKKGKVTDKNSYLSSIRRVCVLLLEILAAVKPEIKAESKARAKKLAVQWKGKMSRPRLDKLESHGFLQLLITFDLASEFNLNEITDHFAQVATNSKAMSFCVGLGLIDKGAHVVQKLLSSGKKILAVRMILELGVADKYHPVPILKEYVKESAKVNKEVSALRQVIKVVEEFNLESYYSVKPLAKRIDQLTNGKVKGNRRRRKKLGIHSGSKQSGSQTDSGSSSSESEPYGSEGSTPRGTPYVGSTLGVAPYWGSIPGGAPYTGSTHSDDLYAELGHSGGAPYMGSTLGGPPYGELRHSGGAPYSGSAQSGTLYFKSTHSGAPYTEMVHIGAPYSVSTHTGDPYVELRKSAPYTGSIIGGAPYGGGANNVDSLPSGSPYLGSTQSGANNVGSLPSCGPYLGSTQSGANNVGSLPSGGPYSSSTQSGANNVGSTPVGVPCKDSVLGGVSSAGSDATSTSYGGSLSGRYGSPGLPPEFPGNLNQPMGFGFYDRSTAPGKYGLPPPSDLSYESQ